MAHSDWEKRPARVSQQLLTLGLAMLLSLPMSGADAIETQTSIQESPPAEIPLPPIVIESTPGSPDLTLDQLMQKFREALGSPPALVISEHQFYNGPLEIVTPFGRLCAEPPPARLESGLGGQINLAAPCAVF